MLHLPVEIGGVVATTASYKGMRREEFLDLIVSRLYLDAVLIELFLIHVLSYFFCKFVHFYNYYKHH
jgi:hypothetical protein